jgi:hypothetical protein
MSNLLNFGHALEALKKGGKVARSGWNGKNMYLYLQKGVVNAGYVLEEESGGDILQTHFDGVSAELFEPVLGDVCTVIPTICMFTASGSIVKGWLASQTDILAEDWQILD